MMLKLETYWTLVCYFNTIRELEIPTLALMILWIKFSELHLERHKAEGVL